MFQELKAIYKRLQELLGKNHPDCILLGATLTCRNCNLSRVKGDGYHCLQWQADIPKEAEKDACDCWKNNVGVGYSN